ncbi:MAG: hypothetical protein HY290_06875 [Planctomycetia bacterium]|nr:hypothetical protein [Planctomycetia bacterium]
MTANKAAPPADDDDKLSKGRGKKSSAKRPKPAVSRKSTRKAVAKSRKETGQRRAGKKTSRKSTRKKSSSGAPAKSRSKRSSSVGTAQTPPQRLQPVATAAAAAAFYDELSQVNEELRTRWAELSQQRTHAEEVLSRFVDLLKSHPEVTGFHVGLWRKDNKIVRPLEYCIQVHVAEKLAKGDPRMMQALPPDFDGVRVDVLERSYSTAIGVRQGVLFDPILGGVEIRNEGTPNRFGTLGLCVFSESSGRAPHYLTNEHVVGSGGRVLQPASGNASAGAKAVIGSVIDSERTGFVDAALIKPSGNRTFDVGVAGPNGQPLDGDLVPGTLTKADEHVTRCFKIGAMTGTGQEVGIVENINEHINIKNFGWMDNQIIVNPIPGSSAPLIQEGDSGSVLIARVTHQNRESLIVVGLVHAMTDDGGIVACHFSRVQERFRISLFDINPV